MRTVFLLGGKGDIGSAIGEKFRHNSCSVIAPTSRELNLEERGSIDKYFENKDLDIDVLVHSAGWNNPKPFENVDYSDIDKTNSINYIGVYRIIRHLLPVFRRKGRGDIVVISSLYGTFAREKRLPYVMSKHALNGLVKTLAIELGPYNIKINAVSPGFVDTKMTRKNNDPETICSFVSRIPLGRMATPEDIADVTFFLCSTDNRYITGQDIIVDGGYSIGGFQNG